MNPRHLAISTVIVSSLTFLACAEKETSGTIDSAVEESAESAVASVGSVIDDHNMNSGFAANLQPSKFQDIFKVLQQTMAPKAYASSCLRAASQACNNGDKVINYASCEVGSTALTIDDGDADINTSSVKLDYSAADCSLDQAGEYVNRTYDYKIVGPRGGTLRVSSNELKNSEVGVSGGGQLTNNGSGSWTVKILGKNQILTGPAGRTLFNHSLQTTQDIQVSGGLARADRLIESGQVKVYHNLAGFNVTHTFSNLQYSATCCHPVSGSINSLAEGSLNKTFSIEFNSCGSATITNSDGDSRNLAITYCE